MNNPALEEDTKQILNLQSPDEKIIRELAFADRQLEFLQPIPSTFTQDVSWDFLSITDRLVSLKEAFIDFKLNVTLDTDKSGYAAKLPDTFHAVAPRSSILSLFSGIDLRTGSGINIVSERNNASVYANHLRLLCEKDKNWVEEHGAELAFCKDEPQDDCSGVIANLGLPPIARFTAAPAADDNNLLEDYNKGAVKRRQHLLAFCRDNKGAINQAAQTFTANVRVPLKYIHDVFAQLGQMPIVNTRLIFQLYLNQLATYNPFHGFSLNDNATAMTSVTGYTITEPRLGYHAIKLKGDESAMFASMLQQGFQKTITFKTYDIYQDGTDRSNVADASSINQQISTSVVQPQKLFMTMYKANTKNTTNPSVLTTGARGVKNFNIYINNRPYLQTSVNDLNTAYDHLIDCMDYDVNSDHKSYISLSDFKSRMRVYGFNLARSHSMAIDPNAPVNVRVEGQADIPNNSDIVFILESKRACTLKISTSEVAVIVAPALAQ